ncbi:MAG: transcriptional regulator [Planctomycetaceae bacterium]
MTNTHPSEQDRAELPPELLALGRAVAQLPAEQFAECEARYAEVVQCFQRRKRILALVQEALSQLRLDVKYLMFDLDVTRRERDELRNTLDSLSRDEFDHFD